MSPLLWVINPLFPPPLPPPPPPPSSSSLLFQPLDLTNALRAEVDAVGEEFLKLEKYVNLNYTACHKILKKHDRWVVSSCVDRHEDTTPDE